MGNIVSCLTPTVNSHGATANGVIVVPEAGGNAGPGGYRFGVPPVTRNLQIVPPAGAPQTDLSSPTTTATTSASNRDRVNNPGQHGEVQQPVQQAVHQPAEQNEFTNRDDEAFGADAEFTAPFSWQKGRQIGQGAFGTVYMALVHATGQEIAVKQVSLPRDAASNGKVSGHIRSLEREVAVLRTLRHDNIVRYLGTERTDEHLNIFLEYVAGGPISSKLAQFGPLREETIRVYTKQILRGLEYLHQQKVMHRDIKGANILVDTNGVVKLADFGASKKIENLATIGGGSRSLHGTAHWMAPEVIKQLGHGRAADIWSLACVVIEMATGQPPWAKFRDPLSVMFHVASTKDMPSLPENLSAHAKDFLTLCFNRVPHERPNATRLLQHPWMQGVTVPRSNRPQNALPPIPAPLPLQHPPAPQQPQQQAHSAPGQQQAPMAQQPQGMPPPPCLRSPPSPIKEESDSRYGSPAAVPGGGNSTPTTARAAMLNAATGAAFVSPSVGHGGRAHVPPLPLEAMKMGTLPSQAAAAPQSSGCASNVVQGGAGLPPLSGGASTVSAPPKPPLPPALQQQASARANTAQAQYDTIVDPDGVQLQLLQMQQQLQQQQQLARPGQALPQNAYDSICMGVGMTISIPEGGPAAGTPLNAMTLSCYNPVEEPSWMPQQSVLNQAILQQLAAISERSTPHSPAVSSGGAAPTAAAADSTTRSATNSSAGGPDATSSAHHADTARLPPPAPASEVALTTMTVSPRSGAGTQRSGAGTYRSGAGTYRGTARGGGGVAKGDCSTGKTGVVVPSRPALAGLFAAAYEEDEGDTQIEPDQPSPVANKTPVPPVFSPNTTLKIMQARQSTAPHSARYPTRTSRRVLEQETGTLGGTLDPVRAKKWRDELEAELEAERMRAGTGVMQQQQHQYRESITTAASAT